MTIPVTIKMLNMELTDDISTYVERKFSKLDKYIPKERGEVLADIEVGRSRNDQRNGDVFYAEINIDIAGDLLRASAERDDLFAAIDEVQDEIVREIKRYKGKHITRVREGARRAKEELHGI